MLSYSGLSFHISGQLVYFPAKIKSWLMEIDRGRMDIQRIRFVRNYEKFIQRSDQITVLSLKLKLQLH